MVSLRSSTLECWHGGVRNDRQDLGFCYSGGEHNRTVQFAGSAMYVHSRNGMTSCNIDESSSVTEVWNDVSWTKRTLTCWEMICSPSNCGNNAIDPNDYWEATVMRRSGGGSFKPGGEPNLTFTSMTDMSLDLHECFNRNTNVTVSDFTVQCFRNNNQNTHDIEFFGDHFRIQDNRSATIVMTCDIDRSVASQHAQRHGRWYWLEEADCYWTGSNVYTRGVLGRR